MKNILILSFCIALVTSCNKEEPDQVAPQLTLQSPSNLDTVQIGGILTVRGQATDNLSLAQLKIEVHSAEDGHGHGKTDDEAFWSKISLINLSGTSFAIDEQIQVPETAAAGEYHLMLTLVDAAGNLTEPLEREILLK